MDGGSLAVLPVYLDRRWPFDPVLPHLCGRCHIEEVVAEFVDAHAVFTLCAITISRVLTVAMTDAFKASGVTTCILGQDVPGLVFVHEQVHVTVLKSK